MRLGDSLYKWMDSFIRFPSAGFDISDASIKIAAFGFQVGMRADFFGSLPLPVGMVMQGEIKEEDALIRFLGEWISREKKIFQSCAFTVSLPEEKGFVRLLELPRIKKEEIADAIRWEVETNIPLPRESLYYDYEPIERSGRAETNHRDVLMIAYPKSIVDAYTRVFTEAGMRLAAFECESQSIVRALLPDPAVKPACMIIDLGHIRTGLAVIRQGTLIFTTTIELGGMQFENAIANELHVDAEEARHLKIQVGLDKTTMHGGVFTALVPSISALASELRRALEFYQSRAPHEGASPPISSIVLSGGGANLIGLDTYLAAMFRIPVVRGDPFARLQNRMSSMIPPLKKSEALGYTTAIGLALRER